MQYSKPFVDDPENVNDSELQLWTIIYWLQDV